MINSNNNPNNQKKFDYIFIGAGLSSLLILLELSKNQIFRQKHILVLDPSIHEYSERTWCFWTKNPSKWASIAKKTWKIAGIFEGDRTLNLNLDPYYYQMLKSTDFRKFVFQQLDSFNNIEWKEELVLEVKYPFVTSFEQQYTAEYIFDSRFELDQLNEHKGLNFYQQFVGYTIQLNHPTLNDEVIRLMDFRMNQPNAVAFCYVLPIDQQTVLVEYTLFTSTIREWSELSESLEQYLQIHFSNQPYTLKDIEKGIIPMTDMKFVSTDPKCIKIGTGGGLSKPSSGYTFHFAEKHASQIVKALEKEEIPPVGQDLYPPKFFFYDKVLLNYLEKYPTNGAKMFYQLFKNNSTESVFDFLNNESSFKQELKIFSSLPIAPFIKSALRSI